MKNLILIFLTGISFTIQGQTNEQALLQSYVSSSDYRWFLEHSQFASNGILDLPGSTVTVERSSAIDGRTFPVLNLNFIVTANGTSKLVGQIQAIKVRDDYNRLPNNGSYLMLYRDYRQYDPLNKTGTIKVYDLNYDEYQAGTADITAGVVGQFEAYPLPPVIAEKYGLLSEKAHHCDENRNGNVTFGECWRCFVNACSRDAECSLLCAIANHATPKGQCHAAFAMSCTWIAIRY